MNTLPLFDIPFLLANWGEEFQQYLASGRDAVVRDLLARWEQRAKLKETASEAAFIKLFFHDLWGYSVQGGRADGAYQCYPQFPVARAGQTGGQGEADLALGHFSPGAPAVPQVLCEFKDIRSSLDAPQNRKSNARTPVQQAFDYLRESRTALTGQERVEPQWVIVTDMNEFRLYHCSKGLAQTQRFVIAPTDRSVEPLTAASESAARQRFLFWKFFNPDSLLADRGLSSLAKLLKNQFLHEKDLEENFYREYRAYREHVFKTMVAANPGFPGTRGKLVRLTQRFLDRCLFILFCEDMGKALQFPPNLFRDDLMAYSCGPFYGAQDSFPWCRLKSIFLAMNEGGTLGKNTINRFNGGLFAPLPELENLRLPAQLFCAENQGLNEDSCHQHPLTLLYFAAKYNFGIKTTAAGHVIDFYALGRIFEQSITELEIMEAEADGRDSLNLLTKRKRDGVYYTPEWVTAYLIEETVGVRLGDLKRELGLELDNRPDEADLQAYLAFRKDKRRTAPRAGVWLKALNEYRLRLNQIRIVDPACGSGAFLIQALEFLKREQRWVIDETARMTQERGIWDADAVIKDILTHNLYGVDINPESVEIAKLALWMHTATPGKPLSSLDHNIQCGNSLVAPDFYHLYQPTLFDEEKRERVNAFDWQVAFPEVFTSGGFDCVVGNPPYVKLQHFRRVQDEVARYLSGAKDPAGQPLYASTQSGNFDLYLPFIEKGLALLNPNGRMGFIAPNVWLMNEYGEALRAKLRATRQLDRWVDFKSYQVFDEAITYTALQLFSAAPQANVRCGFAPDGDMSRLNWNIPHAVIPYAELPTSDAWNLMPAAERSLINRLKRECKSLGDAAWTQQIFQGLITSADSIYHLTRLENGRFKTAAGAEIAIEPDLMRPLVSGPEAKRYQVPHTDTYLLFPYKLDEARPRLFTADEMATRFPNGWRYLRTHEATLRRRENGMFDDNAWYRFGRNQNIDKQEFPKLLVPRLVERLFCVMDDGGNFFLDNVDVGGVLPTMADVLPYLCGILNAPVCNFVWRRIAKPFQNNYYSANKQFIAPLPIPDATPVERQQVAEFAKQLQEMHTKRRDLIAKFDRRLNSAQTIAAPQAEAWLWADLHTAEQWRKNAPAELPAKSRAAWGKQQRQACLDAHLADLDARLKPGATLAVTHTGDELRLSINGTVAIELFDQPDTPLLAAQWIHALRSVRVTEAFNGRKLVKLLLGLRAVPDANIAQTLLATHQEIAALDVVIATTETALNDLTYQLYKLTPAEIALVAD